jgi:hypothetical protein
VTAILFCESVQRPFKGPTNPLNVPVDRLAGIYAAAQFGRAILHCCDCIAAAKAQRQHMHIPPRWAAGLLAEGQV